MIIKPKIVFPQNNDILVDSVKNKETRYIYASRIRTQVEKYCDTIAKAYFLGFKLGIINFSFFEKFLEVPKYRVYFNMSSMELVDDLFDIQLENSDYLYIYSKLYNTYYTKVKRIKCDKIIKNDKKDKAKETTEASTMFYKINFTVMVKEGFELSSKNEYTLEEIKQMVEEKNIVIIDRRVFLFVPKDKETFENNISNYLSNEAIAELTNVNEMKTKGSDYYSIYRNHVLTNLVRRCIERLIVECKKSIVIYLKKPFITWLGSINNVKVDASLVEEYENAILFDEEQHYVSYARGIVKRTKIFRIVSEAVDIII